MIEQALSVNGCHPFNFEEDTKLYHGPVIQEMLRPLFEYMQQTAYPLLFHHDISKHLLLPSINYVRASRGYGVFSNEDFCRTAPLLAFTRYEHSKRTNKNISYFAYATDDFLDKHLILGDCTTSMKDMMKDVADSIQTRLIVIESQLRINDILLLELNDDVEPL